MTCTILSTPQWSVRSWLTWLVLACLLPGAIGAGVLFLHQIQEGRAQQERDTIGIARALVQAVDSYLLRVQAFGEALASAESLTRGDLVQFHGRVRRMVDASPLIANAVLRQPDEQLILNALIPLGKPLPEQPSREHVRRVFLTGKPAISDLYRVEQFPHPIISVDVPVINNGKVIYSLGMSVFPEDLNRILRSQNLPRGWVAAVFDTKAIIVARNIAPEKFVGNKITSQLFQAVQQAPEGSVAAISQEGIPLRSSYSRSPVTGWSVTIGIPRQSLQEALVQSLSRLAVGVAAMFLVGLLLARLIGGRIAVSVRNLTAPALALGRDEPVQPPKVHLKEATEVSGALVQASRLLQQRNAALQGQAAEVTQAHTRLRNVIDNSPALIYLKDLQGNLLVANKAYERLIVTDGAKVIRNNETLPSPTHAEGPSAADRQVIETGDVVQFEEEIRTQRGKYYYAVSKSPLFDHQGHLVGVCGAAVDVTPLKDAEARIHELVATLEARVAQRTQELHQANSDLEKANAQLKDANAQLEAFTYTVAHDLRAPLRGIQGFADAVKEDYADQLEAVGQNYLQRIINAAERMEQLIDDLLTFSRLSRAEMPIGPVDLNAVLKDVLHSLEAQIQEKYADVAMTPDFPWAYANPTGCMHVFQNLISNAIKFSRKTVQPQVKIWPELRRDEQNTHQFVRIWIEDNGIGIPVNQLQRIFQPFERLHGVSEHPGSGIGLAIVDIVVRRMQGYCGAESEVDTGSRFWVELPVLAVEEK